MHIDMRDKYTGVRIEKECGETLPEVIEELVIPALLALGYLPETIHGHIRIDEIIDCATCEGPRA